MNQTESTPNVPLSSNGLCAFAASILLVVLGGCSRGLNTSYGPSKGYTAHRSVNGFSAFRDGFVSAGFYSRDLNRLTDRVNRASVIVWTPTTPSGIEGKTKRWLDRWLRRGSKTLIYVVPDSGSEAEYYREARSYASPGQRLEYRRKYAERLVIEHQWQVNRTPLPSNGWFNASPIVTRSRLVVSPNAEDRWKESFAPATNERAKNGVGEEKKHETVNRHEWSIQPFAKSETPQQTFGPGVVVGPGGAAWNMGETYATQDEKAELEPLLETSSGETIVAKVTNELWPTSQVFVIAGGSMLTNFGLTKPGNQLLADQLIDASIQPLVDAEIVDRESLRLGEGDAPLVAFGSTPRGFPVSEAIGEIPRATGAELLTVFPLSLVTIHMALLGIVICMTLLPTFGRPRKVVYHALTNFGDHLDAIASLMRKRGGEKYARQRVSDYFRRVRGETSGKWVLEEPRTPKVVQANATAASTNATQPPLSQSTAGGETKVNNDDENPFHSSEAER